MSEEFKNSENKPFTVNISDNDFAAEDIPAPESDVPAQKPHKVVRYVETPAPKAEKPKKEKKGGFVGEFLAGAAAGAKSVGESISAGAKSVSEKKPEKAAKAAKEDETQFPKDNKKSSGGFMSKLNSLPVGAIGSC